MSVAREDYIQRQIGLLAEAIRRLRGMLGGEASPEVVIAEIRAAEAELLGTKAPVVRILDSATAARLRQGRPVRRKRSTRALPS